MQPAVAGYTKRAVPGTYDQNFVSTELGNIQRAIAPRATRTVTADTTALVTDDVILANPTSGAITVTLPDPSRVLNLCVTIKQITSNAHAVTIGGTVDGSASPTLGGTNKAITVQSDGAHWWKIGAV
jgi:hypothetical protein